MCEAYETEPVAPTDFIQSTEVIDCEMQVHTSLGTKLVGKL